MSNRSIRRTLGSMVLAFEAFIVFFGTLVAFGLKVAPAPTVWAIGLSFSAVMILTPGYLGKKGSYWFGWFLQLVLFVISFYVDFWMIIVSVIFVSLWAWAMIAGATIDLARKARESVDTFELTVESKESK